MDDVDTFHIQQTPPPSPYHETTWDLKLDQVQEALLHPKEKKLGYLELYFQGFMEFADDVPPAPEASDDETEYPRWGSMRRKSRDQASMSSATSVVSQDFSTSITGDSDQHICATPQRMGRHYRTRFDSRKALTNYNQQPHLSTTETIIAFTQQYHHTLSRSVRNVIPSDLRSVPRNTSRQQDVMP
jgi:hypothetical protein